MKRVLAVAALTVTLVSMGSTAAFADSPNAYGIPGEVVGPNSAVSNGGALADAKASGDNYGHCQSQFAKDLPPGDKDIAQDLNPALFTAGQPDQHAVICDKS
jgi:hypothetical protein